MALAGSCSRRLAMKNQNLMNEQINTPNSITPRKEEPETTYQLLLTPIKSQRFRVGGAQRLRLALKTLLRAFGLRAVSVREVAA